MPKLELSSMLTVVLRLRGQDATGPTGVFDQSIDLMRSPISPPPIKVVSARDVSSEIAGSLVTNVLVYEFEVNELDWVLIE